MSQAALCLAAVARIRSVLSLDATGCAFMLDGKPPPAFAVTQFLAVHPGDWRAPEEIEGLVEEFGFQVTLTRMTGNTPWNQWGTELWAKAGTGMEAVLRQVLVALHLDRGGDALMAAANALIADPANKLVVPPRFRGVSQPQPKGYDWLQADPPRGRSGAAAPAVVAVLTAGGARRYQTIEAMT